MNIEKKCAKFTYMTQVYDKFNKFFKDLHVTPRDVTQFLEEATIMKDFQHSHVLQLVGVAIQDDRVYVVLPYMENGDLKTYVSNDDNVSIQGAHFSGSGLSS